METSFVEKIEIAQFNLLLSSKSLAKLDQLLKAGQFPELVDYLTSARNEVKSLDELDQLTGVEQLLYIKAKSVWKIWQQYRMFYEIARDHLGPCLSVLRFMCKRFLEAGYEKFPILDSDDGPVNRGNSTVVHTCLSYIVDIFLAPLGDRGLAALSSSVDMLKTGILYLKERSDSEEYNILDRYVKANSQPPKERHGRR